MFTLMPGLRLARRRERDPDVRVARRSKYAGIGLAVTLMLVSLFAVWTSQTTGAAASRAQAANSLSDDYAHAANALAGEESLERKYRLEPGPEVRARFDRMAAAFVVALADVRRDGSAADKVQALHQLVEHRKYLRAMSRVFAAVDRGDRPASLRIDAVEAEPRFVAIVRTIRAAADAKHEAALTQLDDLQRLENMNRRLTPLVFLIGLVIAGGLASVTRGHRRLLVAERAQAVHDSTHDALSGLPNRQLLTTRLAQHLAGKGRHGTSTGLLLIDLDRFKEINDTFGHHYGDALLGQIGPRLTEQLREVDMVARLGGDEFAVLVPEVESVDHAVAISEQLARALETPFQVFGIDIAVEASIGIVTSGAHGHDAGTLLQRADIAMYVAKSKGTGIVVYDAETDRHSAARLALLGELRGALERDELMLHYQPKISVRTGVLVGAEALVRWQHPEHGMIFPDDFIPLAEHTGLVNPLARHVLDIALLQARTWADAGRPLAVSVNLSARNLLDEKLPEMVAGLLDDHGVDAALLELEITESALMTEPARAQEILRRLSVLGVSISIDDFGVGYTSLSQLKTLPVSQLKIDRSFVMTMTEDTNNALIVESVIDLGHQLGLTIVAEGVETAAALDALDALGCDIAQGYFVGRPGPVETLDIARDGQGPAVLPSVPAAGART